MSRHLTLTNASTEPSNLCLVSGIEMAPGSNLAFQVVDPSGSSILLAQGQARTVEIRAVVPGDARVGDTLRGTVRMSVSGEPSPRELPVDLQVNRCLVVDPPRLDFGLTQQTCVSPSKTVEAYNVCGLPIVITGTSIPAAPFRIISSPLGQGPVMLSPASHLSIQLASAPTTVGTFSETFRVESEEAAQRSSEGVSLQARADPFGIQEDSFTQGPAAVDILLVIDDSGSMSEEQAALATNFAAFISSATQSANRSDWRIGVTTTDVGRRGELVRTATNPSFLAPTTPMVEALFAQKVRVGTSGSGSERPFTTMALAVTEPALSGANAGFLRPGATLAVVIVTDAIEQSPNDVGSYLAIMRGAKGNHSELFSLSVVGPFSPASATCVTEGQVDTGRFLTAIQATGGVKADICTSNWSMELESISRNVFAARRHFTLVGTPRGVGAITVTVNGVASPASAWALENDAVVFNTAPPPGSAIVISYPTACF